jgi:PiT family inorganic phosphate transporter
MDLIFILLIAVVGIVTVFDFTNGFHDAADMIATAIASRAMTPTVAILLVTLFTFIAPFTVGLAVADTVGNFIDISGIEAITAENLVMSGVLAAVSYNLITWKLALPSSSSNSLVGGLVGAALFSLGSSSVHWGMDALMQGQVEGVMKIVVGLIFSPFAAFIVGFLLMKLFVKLFARLTLEAGKFFIAAQYMSVSWLGFSHGANDAQKGMAIIGMMLYASGQTNQFSIPVWVIILCTSAISLGTLFGGWSIIKTLGFGLIKVKNLHSFTDQVGAALINTFATSIGAPTSTTQIVTATLLGIGAEEKPRHVRWQTALHIVEGWLLNIPTSMLLGALYCMIFTQLWG